MNNLTKTITITRINLTKTITRNNLDLLLDQIIFLSLDHNSRVKNRD